MEGKDEVEFHLNKADSCEETSPSANEQSTHKDLTDLYLHIPYGFQPKACYKPKSKSKEITGVTYNSRSRQFIILDSKGITAWSYNSVVNSVCRLLEYPSYQFNLIRLLLHSKKFNVYFGLSKDYALKVFNINFLEVFSVISDMNSVLCMVFNSVTDELITGGTGGVRFWRFGEIKRNEHSLIRDSRPMANYGLILRCKHPAMGGSMVKDIILDERNQRLYCLSERDVVAYDMEGKFLFQLKSAHQGLVTGCVYSKFSNFVVTCATDCKVNVWSSNGGCVHSFHGHSKAVTNLLLHPEAPSLIITSSQDGTVKIFSLDIMEEIYSHTVFTEGIQWMNLISNDALYCATSKGLQVFSINHVANFWTMIRCPLKSLSLCDSHSKTPRVLAIGEDNSTRLLSKTSVLLSTVLPPPPVTTVEHKQSVRAHAYSPLYSLMYLLVNEEEIWVYYTKSNPANRVEVWQLSHVREITHQENHEPDRTKSCELISGSSRHGTAWERAPSRSPTSPSPLSTTKTVDDIPCLALAFLNSPVLLKTTHDESHSDISYFLVAGLQDGRLLFLSPFSGLLMYFQLKATKGAILSIQHDATHNTLLLNTITLNEFTIEIRTLPNLELQYQVNVGKDLTCFVRMDNTLLSGHETGRLNLHHLVQEQLNSQVVATTFSAQKLSKDHLDAVLSIDANNDLLLFCSSSKDGCIKIWDNAKILLREITMDKSLTSVCFLNSSGDLLAGFRNHVFSISRDKASLSLYSANARSRKNSVTCGTESDVYEDPRVRFEYKKHIPAEPVRMETYLVPFANMSINLARFLSGLPPPSTLEDDLAGEFDETESELSDLFSVAPTEVYMSHDGTPLSRSRSSSISSWDLPNLGCSPVSSPPRTPPLAMSPVLESESDDEHNTAPDGSTPVENKEPCSPSCKRFPQEHKESNRVRVMPVFSLRKRPGLSQVKIDSRVIRAKSNINGDQHARVARGGREDNTNAGVQAPKSFQFNRPKRAPRTIVNKSKQSVERTSGRIRNQRRWRQDKPQSLDSGLANDIKQDEVKENTMTVADGKRVLERSNGLKTDEENMRGYSSENARVPEESSTITKVVIGGTKEKSNGISRVQLPDQTELELGSLDEAKDEIALGVNSFSSDAPSSLITTTPSTDVKEQRENSYVDAFGKTGTELTICNGQEAVLQQRQEEKGNPLFVEEDKLLFSTDIHIHLDVVEEKQDKPVSITDSVKKEQDKPVLKTGSVEEEQDKPVLKTDSVEEEPVKAVLITGLVEEEQDKPVLKTGLFEVSENRANKEQVSRKSSSISRPLSSNRVPHKSGRRSISPVNPSPKVVSVLDSPCVGDQGGQQLHPSSALKIYALAKTHRESPTSGISLVSRPRVKQRSFVKHCIREESFGEGHAREITDEELKRIIRRCRDVQGSHKTKTAKESEKMETAKEKRNPREKKELVNWCMNALTEKVKYPVFAPRPRLRSRRSMKEEGSEAKTDTEFVAARGNYSCEQCETDRDQEYQDLEAWKQGKTSTTRKQEAWLENESINPGALLALKKEHVKEMSQSAPSVYSEGWQQRFLEKNKNLKEKRFERQRKVSERRRAEEEILEEKRINLLGPQGCGGIELDRKGFDIHSRSPQQEDESKNTRSSLEDFKNNPAISQPYRLGKFSSDKDGSWMSALKMTPECQYAADSILELIPRPKSAPSIPSKCRKYILVATESANIRNKPELTPLEETLIFKRFPKSKFKPRARSPQASELLRPRSVAKMQTVHVSCE